MTSGNGASRPDLQSSDIGAEEASLGSLLIDSSAIASVRDILRPADFFITKNQWIYKSIYELADRGIVPDLITVSAELDQAGKLVEIGGVTYLSRLLDVPNPLHVLDYVHVVLEHSTERKRAQALVEAGQAVNAGNWSEAARILQGAADYSDTRKSDTWNFFSLADAYLPRAPLQFLLSGLIAAGTLVILYGAPGTLKSLLLADMAICVAAGLPWLEPLPDQSGLARAVIQVPVMWADFDNGLRRTHERFEALGRARNVPADVPLYYVSMPAPWLDASSTDAIVDLGDRIMARDVKLVIIDNLGAIAGDADENSADMIRVMANLRWLTERTGAAVVVSHHQRKSTGFVVRAGESLRGHSSIEAAIDLGLLIEREEHSNLLTIKSTKTRDTDVPPFGAQFAFEHRADSNELATARFWGMPIEDVTSDHAVRLAIIEAVTDHHPLNGTKMVETVRAALPDVGVNRIRNLANDLVSEGRLVATTGVRRSKLYDLV